MDCEVLTPGDLCVLRDGRIAEFIGTISYTEVLGWSLGPFVFAIGADLKTRTSAPYSQLIQVSQSGRIMYGVDSVTSDWDVMGLSVECREAE